MSDRIHIFSVHHCLARVISKHSIASIGTANLRFIRAAIRIIIHAPNGRMVFCYSLKWIFVRRIAASFRLFSDGFQDQRPGIFSPFLHRIGIDTRFHLWYCGVSGSHTCSRVKSPLCGFRYFCWTNPYNVIENLVILRIDGGDNLYVVVLTSDTNVNHSPVKALVTVTSLMLWIFVFCIISILDDLA